MEVALFHEMMEADWVQVTTLVDNHVSALIRPTENSQTPANLVLGLAGNETPLVAEFGWSTLLKVGKDGKTHTILYDAGLGKRALIQNARALSVELKSVEALVLSHGHPDHTGSVREAVAEIGRDGLPVVMHPWASLQRMAVRPDGTKTVYPTRVDERELHELGADLRKTKGTSSLVSESVMVTGEIPRLTPFEKGLPPNTQYLKLDGEFKHEPLVLDDQALIVNVRDKGLVILTGCGHSGIVNTVDYARRAAGVDRVHAIIGGFHLEGAYFDPVIDPTVESLKRISPKFLVPSHCTGLRASLKLLEAMPSGFLENSVGTTFRF